MEKLFDNFDIYRIKNFWKPFRRSRLIQIAESNYVGAKLRNVGRDRAEEYDAQLVKVLKNSPVISDPSNFYKKLYHKFYTVSKSNFQFTKSKSNNETCWIYRQQGTGEDWMEKLLDDHYIQERKNYWHEHTNTSTICSVYYLIVTEGDFIEFMDDHGTIKKLFVHNDDLLIFPNHLLHRPGKCAKKGKRISINMEILCKEKSEDIFTQFFEL